MPRIQPLDPDTAHGKAGELLTSVRKKFGKTPNMLATMAHAPAVLEGYLGLGDSLARGTLPAGLREQVALAVAGANGCDYCASAHTAIGIGAGVSPDELASSLEGEPADPKSRAAVRFARAVTERRGWVGDEDLRAVRAAGFSDSQVLELVAAVALNTLTNYVNHIAQTEVDFPLVRTPNPAGA